MRMMILSIALLFLLFHLKRSEAHEPLYGFGPGVLFQGGFAPHFTYHYSPAHIETEYALGYGITKDWTVKAELPFELDNGNYALHGVKLKQKYRVYSKFEKGRSVQISGLTSVRFPLDPSRPTVTNVGVTGGQEALHWYWFFGASYGIKSGTVPQGGGHGNGHHGNRIAPGDHLTYNATLGYRPIKTSYYKPDIVFFVEGIGKYQRPSVRDGRLISGSGGKDGPWPPPSCSRIGTWP